MVADAEQPVGVVGARLRDARREVGITTRDLAKATGVSQSMISMIENDRAQPSMATLFRLAEGLGLRPQQLLPTTAAGSVTVLHPSDAVSVRMSEASAGPDGRLLVSGPDLLLEVIEYRIEPGDKHRQWFEHEGEEFIHVLDGTLRVELDEEGGREEVVRAGGMLHQDSRIPHRWSAVGKKAAKVLLVTANPLRSRVHGSGTGESETS